MANEMLSQEPLGDDQILASVLSPIRHPPRYTWDWKDTLFSMFAVWVLFVAILLPVGNNSPPTPRKFLICGLSLVVLQSFWSLLAILVSLRVHSRKHKPLRTQGISTGPDRTRVWFYTYQGIDLSILGTLFFLGGAQWLHLFDERADAFVPVLGFYILLLAWSVLQRRLLLQWAVEGLPRWLKWFLFGSTATGAGIGTGIGIILGRYGPRSIVELTIGLIAFGFALVSIPRAVYDLYVAYLHWQAWRREKEVAS